MEFRSFLEKHLAENPEFRKRWEDGAPRRAVCQQLVGFRVVLGLSQNDIARRSHVSQAHISKVETGLIDPRLSSLLKICDAMGLKIVFVKKEADHE